MSDQVKVTDTSWDDVENPKPLLSAYTTVLSARSRGYPYLESIRSMLAFADEVVVVDGGSTDGTRESIEALGDPRIRLHVSEYDPAIPPMDGMQKQIARSLCRGRYLWQQDADEVLHEEHAPLVKGTIGMMPEGMDLMALPVIELWGDSHTVRTGTHSWKWRLSRNVPRLVHGICIRNRRYRPDGMPFAMPGTSDGCEYIDAVTGEAYPFATYYRPYFDHIRANDPRAYAQVHNGQLFRLLPSVFHYSWCDLERKVRNHRDFWDGQWNALYQEPTPRPFFPEVDLKKLDDLGIKEMAAKLKGQGDPRFEAPTFELDISNPRVMEGWLRERGL